MEMRRKKMKATIEPTSTLPKLTKELKDLAAGAGGAVAVLTPDLSISAHSEGSGCNLVKFTVRLAPAIIAQLLPDRTYRVKVFVHDLGGRYAAREYMLSSRGQTVTDTIDVGPAALHEGPITYWLFVDPQREIEERDENNNFAKVTVACVL
jgi:hypothetical protein